MKNGGLQGQSLATVDKERCIAATLAVNMKIVAGVIRRWNNNRFSYWHLDTNAGSGWNGDVGVDGSPIVFHKMADLFLDGIRREAWFCDIDRPAVADLLNRLGVWNKNSYVFNRDNEEVLDLFAHRLENCGENPRHLMGSVLVDPNGWFYRNKQGEGAPIGQLMEFVKRFPKIDVVLNLNTRARHLMREHGWYQGDISPREVLDALDKQFWQVRQTTCKGHHFMLAVGRNIRTNGYRAIGFHDIESTEGKELMLRFEGNRQFKNGLSDEDPTVPRL